MTEYEWGYTCRTYGCENKNARSPLCDECLRDFKLEPAAAKAAVAEEGGESAAWALASNGVTWKLASTWEGGPNAVEVMGTRSTGPRGVYLTIGGHGDHRDAFLTEAQWRAMRTLPIVENDPAGDFDGLRSRIANALGLLPDEAAELTTEQLRGRVLGVVHRCEFLNNDLQALRAGVGKALGRTPEETAALTDVDLAARVEALAKDRDRLQGEAGPERVETRHCGACEKETTWHIGPQCTACWCRLEREKRAAEDELEAAHAERAAVCQALDLAPEAPLGDVLFMIRQARSSTGSVGQERDHLSDLLDQVRGALGLTRDAPFDRVLRDIGQLREASKAPMPDPGLDRVAIDALTDRVRCLEKARDAVCSAVAGLGRRLTDLEAEPGVAVDVDTALHHVYGAIVELVTSSGSAERAKADALLARDVLRALLGRLRGDAARPTPGERATVAAAQMRTAAEDLRAEGSPLADAAERNARHDETMAERLRSDAPADAERRDVKPDDRAAPYFGDHAAEALIDAYWGPAEAIAQHGEAVVSPSGLRAVAAYLRGGVLRGVAARVEPVALAVAQASARLAMVGSPPEGHVAAAREELGKAARLLREVARPAEAQVALATQPTKGDEAALFGLAGRARNACVGLMGEITARDFDESTQAIVEARSFLTQTEAALEPFREVWQATGGSVDVVAPVSPAEATPGRDLRAEFDAFDREVTDHMAKVMR